MQSLTLLPELRQLPSEPLGRPKTLRELATDLLDSHRLLHAAEAASASSFAMWSVFPGVNVADELFEAYEKAYPGLALDGSLYEHSLHMAEAGDASLTGFISGLKGKLAEFHAQDILEQNGYSQVEITADPTQAAWDINALDGAGNPVAFQVKTGAESYSHEVVDALEAQPDVHFLVSSEIYSKIASSESEYIDRITDVGYDYEIVEDINEGLDTLSANMGIDIPDGILDVIPYAAIIIAAARLLYSVMKTELEFEDADRNSTNKVHVVRTLTLMSRFGITTVLTTVGAMGGVAAGSVVPGVGNIIGGISGTVSGAAMAVYLNRYLQPHMLDIALDISGLTHDDLFYYKNKAHIDGVAVRFHETARLLSETN